MAERWQSAGSRAWVVPSRFPAHLHARPCCPWRRWN